MLWLDSALFSLCRYPTPEHMTEMRRMLTIEKSSHPNMGGGEDAGTESEHGDV
jgi:hypothetical protein